MSDANVIGTTTFKHDIQNMGQSAAALGRSATDAAHSGAAELRHGAQHAMETAKRSAADATASLRDTVAHHPIASIGIAAALGALLGLVIFRPRS